MSMVNSKMVLLFLTFVVYDFNYFDRINLFDNSVINKQDEPTYEETRSWILEKLKLNIISIEEDEGYGNSKQEINDDLDIFTDYFYFTNRIFTTKSYMQSVEISKFKIDLRDFKEIKIVRFENSCYMYIKTNSKNVKVETKETKHLKQPTTEEYMVNVAFLQLRTSLEDDMEDRFNKAFNHLKKIRKKKNPLTTKEPF